MRLIDADALKEWFETENENKWGLSTDEVMDAIEAAPTIDQKHGDLIDRDALIKSLRDYACKPCKEYGADKNGDRCSWCSFDDAFARIEKAKAVIPAERSEE